MLGLAAADADGAHPYFVPVEHTARAREILGPGKLLAPELAVVLEPDATEARRLARSHTSSFYLQAPNYVENLRWFGSATTTCGAAASTRWSMRWSLGETRDAIAARIREHLDAGADHLCLQPVTEIRPLLDGPDLAALDILRRLAAAVRDL